MKRYIRLDSGLVTLSDASTGQTKDVHELALTLMQLGVDGSDIIEFFLDNLPSNQCYDLLKQLADERGIDV